MEGFKLKWCNTRTVPCCLEIDCLEDMCCKTLLFLFIFLSFGKIYVMFFYLYYLFGSCSGDVILVLSFFFFL